MGPTSDSTNGRRARQADVRSREGPFVSDTTDLMGARVEETAAAPSTDASAPATGAGSRRRRGTGLDGMVLAELQQVASPQDLYDHPVNLFVGGFIGSPAMNMLEAKIERSNGGYAANLGSQKLQLGDHGGLGAYEGKDVIVGIRPEDIEDAQQASDGGDGRRLRGQHDFVKRFLRARKSAVGRISARDVRCVAVQFAAGIDQHQLAVFQHGVAGAIVKYAGICSGCDDRGIGRKLRSVFPEFVQQFGFDLIFAQTGARRAHRAFVRGA